MLENYFKKTSLIFAGILVPIVASLERSINIDWPFAINMFLLVFIDTILGVYLAFKRKNITSERFSRVINKIFIYILLLASTHIMVSYKVNGQDNIIFQWLDYVVYSVIMAREMLSIIEKSNKLGVILPSWITDRLEDVIDNKTDIENKYKERDEDQES